MKETDIITKTKQQFIKSEGSIGQLDMVELKLINEIRSFCKMEGKSFCRVLEVIEENLSELIEEGDELIDASRTARRISDNIKKKA